MGQAAEIMHRKVSEPAPRGERVAAWVEEYLRLSARSLGELAFSIRADKRDLQRLLRDRSCGWRLEDALAAYFGKIFVSEVFAPVVGSGPSRREQELAREYAEISSRSARLDLERSASSSTGVRLVSDEDRRSRV